MEGEKCMGLKIAEEDEDKMKQLKTGEGMGNMRFGCSKRVLIKINSKTASNNADRNYRYIEP